MSTEGPNAAMVEHWNGAGGERWARDHASYDTMLRPFAALVLDAAALQPGERVLDVGCGNGATSLEAGRQVGTEGSVLGLDVSGPMLARARQRAEDEGLAGTVRFVQADAQTADLDDGQGVDIVISRFGVMFFSDPAGAFDNLARAVRPGGRLAYVCWRGLGENPWLSVPGVAVAAHVALPTPPDPDAPGPFSLAEPDRIRAVLAAAWEDVDVRPVDTSILVGGGGDVDEVVTFFAGTDFGTSVLAGIDGRKRTTALASVAEALRPYATADGVRMPAAAWVVTARRC